MATSRVPEYVGTYSSDTYYCYKYEKDWDIGIHLVLFTTREAVHEFLGFSPFDLVFSHIVRGPLKLLKEKWLTDTSDLYLLY